MALFKQSLLAAFMLLFIASTGMALDPSGEYSVQVTSYEDGEVYQGQAKVSRMADVYIVVWNFDDQHYTGTGLLQDNSFAVVYDDPNTAAGLALYKVLPSGELKGIYTNMGQTAVGTEMWKPIKP